MQIFVSIKFSVFLLCLKIFLSPIIVHSVCNVCQKNGVACTNMTAYNFCFGRDTPYTDQEFVCQEGLVCTDLELICFQKNIAIPASCGDITSCGKCNENEVFACTSRTTFSFCFGAATPSKIGGTCPKGTVCDASAKEMCVDSLYPGSIVCDRETPI